MADNLIIRVMSKAGRSRIEISAQKTMADLKHEISKRMGVDPK